MSRGYALVPLQRRWVRDRIEAAPAADADAMLLLLPDARLLEGVDAYLHIGRRVWWAAPLAVIGALPGFHWLLQRLYAWVARHRHAISRAWGLR